MGKFKRAGGFHGHRGGRGDYDQKDKQMFSAVCSECGQDCQVPFRPTGEKPVYCSNCFKSKGGFSDPRGGNFRDRRDSRDSYNDRDKKMFSATCVACGQDCQVPFRPTGEKPVYCSNCFKGQKNSPRGDQPKENFSRQFQELNSKLDRLIKFLIPEPKVIVKPLVEKKATKGAGKKSKAPEKKSKIKKSGKKKVAEKKK